MPRNSYLGSRFLVNKDVKIDTDTRTFHGYLLHTSIINARLRLCFLYSIVGALPANLCPYPSISAS
jgi:hypothetical protein